MEFQEKYKIDVGRFSSGSTAEIFTPYYDMRGYKSADFLFEGIVHSLSSGGLGATDFGQWTLRAMQATSSTGGGASAISSATAVVGKESATGFSATRGCREGWISFSTISGSAALNFTVGTAAFVTASVATPAAAMTLVAGASAQATVAREAFITLFNSTQYNTSTVLVNNWYACTDATVTGDPWVRIIPRNQDSTNQLALGTTGSSQIAVGGVFTAHIGVSNHHLKEGARYVSLGVKSTEFANPFTVTVIREPENKPAKNIFGVDKTLQGSTGL